MRLLKRRTDGELVLTEFHGNDVPPYAILSHTWGEEEVSFEDVQTEAGKLKQGWQKIQFCTDKAEADGLRYSWIDTCCIDKKNAVELAAAINSMFRWYQKASRCYVYLTDVREQTAPGDDIAFRSSRWFSRSWTLQELIAPASVEFFTSDGALLGNKATLETGIYEVTGISKRALGGDTLTDFSIHERTSWTLGRQATLEEDKVYCLLGLFGVAMPLIYGEGEQNARRRLQEEIHKSYKGVEHETFSVTLDMVSLPEAALFTARERELAEMHGILSDRTKRSIVVLHGLGGMGKTQLSIEYIRRHKEKFTAIFWLNANDDDALKLSFQGAARQIVRNCSPTPSLEKIDLEGDLDAVVNGVKAWLSLRNNTSWLLVFDNLDDPGKGRGKLDIIKYLPGADHGSLIITSRSARISHGYRLGVSKLQDVKEGLQILSNTCRRSDVDSNPDAVQLVKELDGLPLALSTAGAYLEHVTTSYADYLRLYRTSWLKLHTTSPQLGSYEDRSLYSTWNITYDRIKQQNPAAAKLLQLWAYFDKQDIWYGLLRHAYNIDDDEVKSLTQEVSFEAAARLLCQYGLVEVDWSTQQHIQSGCYCLHSCVHAWTTYVLNQKRDDDLARVAWQCIGLEIPLRTESSWWILQRRLLPHASRLINAVTEGREGDYCFFLNRLGLLYTDQGKQDEAEATFLRLLNTLDPKHVVYLAAAGNLANLYDECGRSLEAERLTLQVLQTEEELYGTNDERTLMTVHNLGSVYLQRGQPYRAENYAVRAVQGCETVLGPSHALTSEFLILLGDVYAKQGNLAESEKTYTRALVAFESLGPEYEHIIVMDIHHSLAELYRKQGRLAEAEALFVKVLRNQEEALGSSHRDVVETCHGLGQLYCDQDRFAEAEAQFSRVLKAYEEHSWQRKVSLMTGTLGGSYDPDVDRNESSRELSDDSGDSEKLWSTLPWIPPFNSMLYMGVVYSRTSRDGMAETIYAQVISALQPIRGFERICRNIESDLQAVRLQKAQATTPRAAETDDKTRRRQPSRLPILIRKPRTY